MTTESQPPRPAPPVDNPHLCKLCGKKIRKNHESYRGTIPGEMARAIQQEKLPTFSVKDDICKECGETWFKKVEPTIRKRPWFPRPGRPLG